MRHKEAPQFVNIVVWSIAGLAALIFVYVLINWLFMPNYFNIGADSNTAIKVLN